MWSAEFDKRRQLLQVRYSDHVSEDEAKACARRVQELLSDVSDGFCLLTDLCDLDEMVLACGPWIDQMMDALNTKGVRRVVRVVPNPEKDIGLGIMSLFHYDRQVRVVTCKSREEAEQHLPH